LSFDDGHLSSYEIKLIRNKKVIKSVKFEKQVISNFCLSGQVSGWLTFVFDNIVILQSE